MGEVAIAEDAAIAQREESGSLIAIVDRLLTMPGLPIDKIEKFIDLQVQAEERMAKKAFYRDMAEFQKAMPIVEHTAEISYDREIIGPNGQKTGRYETIKKGSYAPWDAIEEIARPLYTEHGFSIRFDIEQPSNAPITVWCVVRHRDGHSERTPFTLPADPSGKKNGAQAWGSALSYAKRYSGCAALNIVTRGKDGETEDDDGEAGGANLSAGAARETGSYPAIVKEMRSRVSTVDELNQWYTVIKCDQRYLQWPEGWKRTFYSEDLLSFRDELKAREPA